MITNNGLNVIRDGMFDGSDINVNYLAVGDDATATAITDTSLGNETARVQISSANKPAAYTVQTIFDLLDSDGTLSIKEIGFYVGGTATINSGILVKRVLYARDKTGVESIQFNSDDVIGRG
jgi:hypothetical protein